MGLFSTVGNAVGGPVADVGELADKFVNQAVPGLGLLNSFVDVDVNFGSGGGVDGQLRNMAVGQQLEDVRRGRRGGRGCGEGGGQAQGCGGGSSGSTLEMLAEVLGNMQEKRVAGLIEKGKSMASASGDQLLKLSTQLQTDKLLLEVAMEASKNVINGFGEALRKPLER